MTDTTIHTAETRAAKKPSSLAGMVPTDIESYGSVPWYRKTWFAFFPPFAPVLFFVALTGDLYAHANQKMKSCSDAEVWRYTVAGRACWAVAALVAMVFWSYVIWSYVV